jgi:hypothetical protein
MEVLKLVSFIATLIDKIFHRNSLAFLRVLVVFWNTPLVFIVFIPICEEGV